MVLLLLQSEKYYSANKKVVTKLKYSYPFIVIK